MPPNDSVGLFERILGEFEIAGVLRDFIIIGSWALRIYRENYDHDPQIPIVGTRDVDFLLTNPPHVSSTVNIASILNRLELEEERSMDGEFAKYIGEDLDVEFLIPDKGRGIKGGYVVREFGITAQPLRYMNFITDNTETMLYKKFTVRVPHPVVFVLMKYLLTTKRTGRFASKISKDVETAESLAFFLLGRGMADEFRARFQAIPKAWQKNLLVVLGEHASDLFEVLS